MQLVNRCTIGIKTIVLVITQVLKTFQEFQNMALTGLGHPGERTGMNKDEDIPTQGKELA